MTLYIIKNLGYNHTNTYVHSTYVRTFTYIRHIYIFMLTYIQTIDGISYIINVDFISCIDLLRQLSKIFIRPPIDG